jgi:ribosome maturation factor RimP
MSKLEEKVEEIVKPIIEELGYSIYDIVYSKEHDGNYLSIYIDNESGIGVDDCEKVNNSVEDIIDKADLIKDNYFLVISSPGVERNIRKDSHLEKAKNSKIQVNLYKALEVDKDLGKELVGKLIDYDDKLITIELEPNKKLSKTQLKKMKKENIDELNKSKIVMINRELISSMKTVYEW